MAASFTLDGILDVLNVAPPRAVGTLNLIAFLGLPVSVAFAVMKYRLYDIDLVINRTLVYGALTAILGAVYIGLIFGFQALLAPFTAESDLAIAASTLAVAALFRPARGRIQGFIDRRFYRRKVDVERILEEFSGRLREDVDLESLAARLRGVVGETMQPAHLSLWLRPGPGSAPVTIPER